MTVYLHKNFFKPAAIALSAVFSVLFLLIGISMILDYYWVKLVVFFGFFAAYGGLLGYAYYKTTTKQHYLQETNQGVEIHYPEVNYYNDVLRLPYNAITGFTYYSVSSWKGWENFIKTGVLPGCMYLHYLTPRGKSVDTLIGHWDKKFAEQFVSRYGLVLKIV